MGLSPGLALHLVLAVLLHVVLRHARARLLLLLLRHAVLHQGALVGAGRAAGGGGAVLLLRIALGAALLGALGVRRRGRGCRLLVGHRLHVGSRLLSQRQAADATRQGAGDRQCNAFHSEILLSLNSDDVASIGCWEGALQPPMPPSPVGCSLRQRLSSCAHVVPDAARAPIEGPAASCGRQFQLCRERNSRACRSASSFAIPYRCWIFP